VGDHHPGGDFSLVTIRPASSSSGGSRRNPDRECQAPGGPGPACSAPPGYLPLKLNAPAGVMPIIFASAVVFLPLTVANLTAIAW